MRHTRYTALEQLKLRLPPDAETDDIRLGVLLSRSKNTILDIIGRNKLPARLVDVQVDLALIAYNKQGAEGESSRTEGGISQTFESVPPDILARLKNYPRKAGVLYTAGKKKT